VRAKITIIGIALIVFHILTEAHSILRYRDQALADSELDLFFSATYKMLLAVKWYLKMGFDDLLIISTYFFFAWVAGKYSRRLLMIVSLWFFYHLADLYMFWWNYKTSYWAYYILLIACVIQTIILIVPVKERTPVINMQ